MIFALRMLPVVQKENLKRAFLEIDNTKLSKFLQDRGADWIIWQRNTPEASYMDRVWEQ